MKPTQGKVVVLVFVAIGAVTFVGVLASMLWGPKPAPKLAVAIDNAEVASSPYTRFRAMDISVGKTCKRVLVASSETQRNQGLRNVTDLDPYAGMLFAFETDTAAQFTMANTKIPLDITFYDAQGKALTTRQMVPCPGTDASCPTYGPDQYYRYALETEQGQMPAGALSPCS